MTVEEEEITEEAREEYAAGMRIAFGEAAWIVAKTGKPIMTVPADKVALREITREAEEAANDIGCRMWIDVSDDPEADVAFPGLQVCFYREDVILAAYQYLTRVNVIPDDVEDCFWGLLYGYRTDAIQDYIDDRPQRIARALES